MNDEKTLLQQIREKEQEYAEKIKVVKARTDAEIASAKEEMESLLCTADGTGKKDAEQIYWQGKAKTEAELKSLREAAEKERADAAARGERNLSRAVEKITGLVTME